MAPEIVEACRDPALRLGGFADFLDPNRRRPRAHLAARSAPGADVVSLCSASPKSGAPRIAARGADPRRQRGAQGALLPHAARHLQPLQARGDRLAQARCEARERLVSLPIWDIAVQTEGRARLNVATYAAVIADPLLRKAIELNAFEEGRHKLVLSQPGRGLWHRARAGAAHTPCRATRNGPSW